MTQAATRLVALFFSDIVGSVGLKERLGDVEYGRMSGRHDEIFVGIIKSTLGAELVKDTGDGFLASFATASDGVNAALRFQLALARETWGAEPIQVRMGVHVGELQELGVDAMGHRKLVGLAADTAARVMGLALPGQILMTRTSFDDARQLLRTRSSPDDDRPPLGWMEHGPYLFKGRDEPLQVFEVGYEGIAPLRPPPDSDKARRSVAADDEETLGWRPAAGLDVPGRKHWALDHKLGEGGFGEVWLAEHRQTRDKRVFKFCFNAERLRSFKRELTLFRLIREALGDRQDIAKLHEIQFEHPPYYLESEFTADGDMLAWSSREGGVAEIPFETRLDLVSRTAQAVAAAHSVGILHKDIKPGNILIYQDENGKPRPRLSDFGIGVLTDATALAGKNITVAGFTETALLDDNESTGTRLYAPPESLVGKPFTTRGDVYALGILLYQMVVGDLGRPLGAGWERDVDDEILREDIAASVDSDPERRLASAGELARRLDELDERRKERRKIERRGRVTRIGVAALAATVVLAAGLAIHSRSVARERDRANQEAETASQVSGFLQSLFELSDPDAARGDAPTVRDLLDSGAERVRSEMQGQPLVQTRLMNTMGWTFLKLGHYDEARALLEDAEAVGRKELGSEHLDHGTSLHHLAVLEREIGDFPRALELFGEALTIREAGLRPEDPGILECLNNIGLLHWRTGDTEGARENLERALTVRERSLPPDDPLLAQSLNNLALVLMDRGDNAKARALFERALTIHEKSLGADHPRVARVLHNLAELDFRSRDYDSARLLYQRALRIYEDSFGRVHPFVARALHGLAQVEREAGNRPRALELLREAVGIWKDTVPEDHPEYAATLTEFAALQK